MMCVLRTVLFYVLAVYPHVVFDCDLVCVFWFVAFCWLFVMGVFFVVVCSLCVVVPLCF